MKLKVKAFLTDELGTTLYLVDGSTFRANHTTHNVQDIIDQIMVPIASGKTAEVTVNSVSVFTAFNDLSKEIKFVKVGNPTELVDSLTPSSEVSVTVGDISVKNLYKITPYIADAVSRKHTKGVEALIKRMGNITTEHTLEDLLTFLEKADLPITDDGTILAYKALNKNGDKFYDIYTGRVEQNVGDIVSVPVSYVNTNRSVECAQGLHIARRQYLKGYRGSHCMLVSVHPEHILAVPHGDPNKVRVQAYTILDVLPNEAYELLLSDAPMTSLPSMQKLLGYWLKNAGSFNPVRRVLIKGRYGTDIEYTDLRTKNTKPKDTSKAKSVKAISTDVVTRDKSLVEATKKRAKQIKKIIDLYTVKGKYQSLSEISRQVGLSRSTVTRILKNNNYL